MEKNNSTISINIPNPMVGIEKIKNILLNFAQEIYNGPIRRVSPVKRFLNSVKNPFRNFKLPKFNEIKFNKKTVFKFILPLVAILVFAVVLVNLLRGFPGTQANPSISTNDSIVLPDAVSTQEINKKFTFSIRDENDEPVGTFDYYIQNAELRKQIIVKGQRATAVEGRIFLIINLKVTNNFTQQMDLPSRSYVRIVVGGRDDELLAADIHNDPVEVLAKSTKYTRIGLAIDEKDSKNIKLLVGEIDGEKETVELNFN